MVKSSFYLIKFSYPLIRRLHRLRRYHWGSLHIGLFSIGSPSFGINRSGGQRRNDDDGFCSIDVRKVCAKRRQPSRSFYDHFNRPKTEQRGC